MCKVDGESVNHLLLHCPYDKELWDTYQKKDKELWDMVFAMFGIQWVMPRRVINLLECWQGRLGQHSNSTIWRVIPHCLMWCLWRERKVRTFEGCEQSVLELKLQFYRSLFDWMSTTGLFSFSNSFEFLDSCYF
jgi:hypothetical protein